MILNAEETELLNLVKNVEMNLTFITEFLKFSSLCQKQSRNLTNSQKQIIIDIINISLKPKERGYNGKQ